MRLAFDIVYFLPPTRDPLPDPPTCYLQSFPTTLLVSTIHTFFARDLVSLCLPASPTSGHSNLLFPQNCLQIHSLPLPSLTRRCPSRLPMGKHSPPFRLLCPQLLHLSVSLSLLVASGHLWGDLRQERQWADG